MLLWFLVEVNCFCHKLSKCFGYFLFWNLRNKLEINDCLVFWFVQKEVIFCSWVINILFFLERRECESKCRNRFIAVGFVYRINWRELFVISTVKSKKLIEVNYFLRRSGGIVVLNNLWSVVNLCLHTLLLIYHQ